MTSNTAVQVFKLESYDLQCSARSMDGGRFAPVLVATKQAWPRRPRVIDVGRGHHADEASAIGAAHSKGIQWIAEFG